MYIQITNRCNMACAHCCYDCKVEGQDMSWETFVKSCAIAEENGDSIAIGGGEPTLHPLFKDMLLYGISKAPAQEEQPLFIATNGTNKDLSIMLADLAKHGIIMATLNQDQYHFPIDKEVIEAFKNELDPEMSFRNRDFREIRNVSQNVKAVGRAKNLNAAKKGCACSDIFVSPKGEVFACGCQTYKLGTIDDYSIPNDFEYGECYRSIQRKRA